MVDRLYAEPSLAALYDLFCPWDPRGDFGFYLPLLMEAASVLDVGCGTGMLLRRARAEGHAGRLCGLDPAAAMLDVARDAGEGVEWVLGDLSSVSWNGEFDLIVMTGHAFQVLTGDDEVRQALAAVHTALTPAGRFAFETRNPLARGWEEWIPENAVEVTDGSGAVVRQEHQVDLPVRGDLVSFTTTYSSPAWQRPQQSRSQLRFLVADALAAFLAGAGLEVAEQYGGWDRSALAAGSPEIITIAKPYCLTGSNICSIVM
ncbi:MAG TPA: class I SAM-dependent methyltransferase [Streptosporangiaceae bacterium]|nr:class I SAM-dependent methyltransferase [Streptosporangiaceae bacterium]